MENETTVTQLSPAAKTVMDSFWTPVHKIGESAEFDRRQAAAALRAAADHDPDGNTTEEYDAGWRAAMDFVDAIAAELEGA